MEKALFVRKGDRRLVAEALRRSETKESCLLVPRRFPSRMAHHHPFRSGEAGTDPRRRRRRQEETGGDRRRRWRRRILHLKEKTFTEFTETGAARNYSSQIFERTPQCGGPPPQATGGGGGGGRRGRPTRPPRPPRRRDPRRRSARPPPACGPPSGTAGSSSSASCAGAAPGAPPGAGAGREVRSPGGGFLVFFLSVFCSGFREDGHRPSSGGGAPVHGGGGRAAASDLPD